jgi:hypothetical protein
MTFWHNSAYGDYGFIGYAGGELAGCGYCGGCPSCKAYGYAGSGDELGPYTSSTPSSTSRLGTGSSTSVGGVCTYTSYGQAKIAHRQYFRLAQQAKAAGNAALFRRYTLMWKCARNEMERLSGDLGWDPAGYMKASGYDTAPYKYTDTQLDQKLRSLVGDWQVQGMESDDGVISLSAGLIGESWAEAAYVLAAYSDPANYDRYAQSRAYFTGREYVDGRIGKKKNESPFVLAGRDGSTIFALMKKVVDDMPASDNMKKETGRALRWFRDNVLATGKTERKVTQYQKLAQTRESGDQFTEAAFVGYDPKRQKELEDEVRAYNKRVADAKKKEKKTKIWDEKWFVPAVAGTLGIMILFGAGTAVRRKQAKAEAAYGY